jgi:four helix bundle protein
MSNQIDNPQSSSQNNKQYNLEQRTFGFARKCRDFINKLPKTITNIEYEKQLARAAGSQAANYIEANESLSKKDFCMRIKICRKEAKESRLWLNLCDIGDKKDLMQEQKDLIQEGYELTKIFGSMVEKCKNQ